MHPRLTTENDTGCAAEREEDAMVEAIQDQWAIVAAVVVLVIAAIVWAYARR
jgi:hypothetical protein